MISHTSPVPSDPAPTSSDLLPETRICPDTNRNWWLLASATRQAKPSRVDRENGGRSRSA